MTLSGRPTSSRQQSEQARIELLKRVAGSNPAGAQREGPAQKMFLPSQPFAVSGAIPRVQHRRQLSLRQLAINLVEITERVPIPRPEQRTDLTGSDIEPYAARYACHPGEIWDNQRTHSSRSHSHRD